MGAEMVSTGRAEPSEVTVPPSALGTGTGTPLSPSVPRGRGAAPGRAAGPENPENGGAVRDGGEFLCGAAEGAGVAPRGGEEAEGDLAALCSSPKGGCGEVGFGFCCG